MTIHRHDWLRELPDRKPLAYGAVQQWTCATCRGVLWSEHEPPATAPVMHFAKPRRARPGKEQAS